MVERFKTNDREGQHTFAFINMYILMPNILHITINQNSLIKFYDANMFVAINFCTAVIVLVLQTI